jgi:hypothetical protein
LQDNPAINTFQSKLSYLTLSFTNIPAGTTPLTISNNSAGDGFVVSQISVIKQPENNNSSTFSANTVVSLPNYGQVGTITNVTIGYTNFVIFYSVVNVINPVCTLNVSGNNYNQNFTVSPTGTSFNVSGLPFDSGAYNVSLTVNYSPGGSYTSPVVIPTLLTYNFLNGGLEIYQAPVTIDTDTTYGTYYHLLSNGSGIYKSIYINTSGNYTLSFNYLSKNIRYGYEYVNFIINISDNPWLWIPSPISRGYNPSDSKSNNVWNSFGISIQIKSNYVTSISIQMDNGGNSNINIQVANFKLLKN